MGLFGGKKIFVASVCYNLAGDEELRPDYMKTMVVSSVLSPDPRSSIADGLRQGYMSGPGMKLRGFYRWAEDNYNSVVGLSSGGLAGAPNIDPATVAAYVPAGAGDVIMQMVRSDAADFEVWAEQWMLQNHPDQFNSAWVADYNDTTNQITITLPSTATYTFTPAGFDKAALYIYAAYNRVTSDGVGPVIEGEVVDLAPGEPFPDTTGWTDEGGGVFTRTELINDGAGRVFTRKYTMIREGEVSGAHSVRIDTQDIAIREWSPMMVFIYKVGSGTAALDALVTDTSSTVGGFFPPIPVRLNNVFLSEEHLPDQYAAAKKAYKRLTAGGRFDDLVTKLEDNEKLSDIDYAFVVPGVSLNVKENSCRKYLYEFFHQAMVTSLYDEGDYTAWEGGIEDARNDYDGWFAWFQAQGSAGDPLNGTPEPSRSAYGSAPRNEIRVRSTVSALGYDTRIAWKAIKEETGAGLGKPGAKVGDVWLEKSGVFAEAGDTHGGFLGSIVSDLKKSEDLLIWWQTGPASWKRLTIRGLVHQNYIYKGKYVEIGSHEALDDEDESGFIVPIHYDTWRSMSLKDTTQMATACVFLVLNCYKVKKLKWYQTGIFRIVLFIAIVVISVVFFGPTGLAIGGPFSVAATASVPLLIASQIANALLAMVITKIVGLVAVELFGDKWGQIIGAVVAFATMSVVSGLNAGLNLSQIVTQMMNPLTLAMFADALGRGIVGLIQANIQDTFGKTQDVLSEYNEQSKAISQLYEQNIGYGRGLFDPTLLLDSSQWFVESGDTFLARTLMTGSDIAELANSLLNNFSDLTLSTDLPL